MRRIASARLVAHAARSGVATLPRMGWAVAVPQGGRRWKSVSCPPPLPAQPTGAQRPVASFSARPRESAASDCLGLAGCASMSREVSPRCAQYLVHWLGMAPFADGPHTHRTHLSRPFARSWRVKHLALPLHCTVGRKESHTSLIFMVSLWCGCHLCVMCGFAS